MKRKYLLVLAVFSLFALFGCGGFEKIQRNVVDPNTDVSNKIDLAIQIPYVDEKMQENKVIPLIEELTGYKCTYTQFPSGSAADSEIEGYFMRKGTDYNAIKLTKNQFNKRAILAAGLADLTSIINDPKYKTLKDSISPEAWEAVTFDGKILGIPDSASNNNIDKAIIIRKDIMYTLTNPDTGKKYDEVPTTFDGFVKLLKAFKEQTGSTTALSLPKNVELVPAIAASFGVEQMWQKIGNEYYYAAENPNLASYLEAMNGLLKEDLLDKNMQTNSFSICATKFVQGSTIATVSNFWELDQVRSLLASEFNKNYVDCVDFITALENKDGEMKTWQSSGCTYVTVIPNWMADTGAHVVNYIQEKIKEENFTKIVCGNENEHYKYDDIKEVYYPLEGFAAAKKNASYFVTGTNDLVYNKLWTQIVIKGTEASYFQWKETNEVAFKRGVKGVTNPVAFAPAMKSYSSAAAGIEDEFKAGVMRAIMGANNESATTIKNKFNNPANTLAIKEVKDWLKNK